MTLGEFVAKYAGKFVTAPGGLGGQCVDLANQYGQEVYGFPHEWKNAIDWYGTDPAHYSWIQNDAGNPAQFPQPGDVVVWGPDAKIGTGPLGHIDIFLSGDGYQFHGFDQNWPVGAPAHVQWHDYEGVIGWGRPIVPPPPPPPPPPDPEPMVNFICEPPDDLHPPDGVMTVASAQALAQAYVAAHPASRCSALVDGVIVYSVFGPNFSAGTETSGANPVGQDAGPQA